MQGLWYGDRRDRVKWGALLHLVKTRSIPRIVQVTYYRDRTDRMLETPEGRVPVLPAVWGHFSDLKQIERLGKVTDTSILVFNEPFQPRYRSEYIKAVVRRLKDVPAPKIVFVDPDTGIELGAPGRLNPKHVLNTDLETIWAVLMDGDLLAVYQHADHTSSWQTKSAHKMSEACGGTSVGCITGKRIAADVAMLWCAKQQVAWR